MGVCFCVREAAVLPFSRQGCARALSCVWCEPGLMTRSGATRRRRLGSSTRPARPRRGVGESAALTNSPGNATLRKYQAAPTARPTVINEKPLAITKNRPRGPCRPAKSCPRLRWLVRPARFLELFESVAAAIRIQAHSQERSCAISHELCHSKGWAGGHADPAAGHEWL